MADMTDWMDLTARAGRAGHDVVGWIMWDPGAIERYAALGVPNQAGLDFRNDLETQTDKLTAPAWRAVGESTTITFLDLVEAHQDAFLQRINETAGPRWMPAVRPRQG